MSRREDRGGKRRDRRKKEKEPSGPTPVKGSYTYTCNYCDRDITNETRVKCQKCKDFDLCIECFSVGAKIGDHRGDHDYSIIDPLSFAVFEPDWRADEELVLLEAVELCGFDNWGEISNYVQTKTIDEARDHYHRVYCDPETFPSPSTKKLLIGDDNSVVEATRTVQDTNIEKPKPTGQSEPKLVDTKGFDLAGWMPKRHEFSSEYDNNCEMYSADIQFKEGQEEIEQKVRMVMLEMYNSRLDEREIRARFLEERGLIDRGSVALADKERTKEERDIVHRARPFARFHTTAENEEFVNGLIEEVRLKRKLKQFQEYRSYGITSLSEIEEFLRLKEKRDMRQKGVVCIDPPGFSAAASKLAAARSRQDESGYSGAMGSNKSDHLRGIELLSAKEREICERLQLLPQEYMTAKDLLLQEYYHARSITKIAARGLLRLPPLVTDRLYDFFASCGWISPVHWNFEDDFQMGTRTSSRNAPGETRVGSTSAPHGPLPAPGSYKSLIPLLNLPPGHDRSQM